MKLNTRNSIDYDALSEAPLTDNELAQMKPLREVMPPEFVNMVLSHQAEMEAQGKIKSRTRGKQKAPTKQSVTIRLSPEVIAAFKATGQGWQSRINDALLQYVHNSM
ncbi:BrnA antitoxin family protein [Pasteurella oralis]|uniref:BrnA antitoxin family protein n=1 Tax=Pasteurella oralis TaxID=1071947 RepID=UPI000C7D86E7|nr:BrnA antitoxin family protein [Pasteurella oralis]